MKAVNATAWRTEDLQDLVDRAVMEAKVEVENFQPPAEIIFLPSSHRDQIRVREPHSNSTRIEVLVWQPIRFKNRLDELTRIAVSVSGLVMRKEMSSQLLVGIKFALGVRHYKPNGCGWTPIEELATKVVDHPIVTERLPEEGRLDEARIDLEQAIIDRERARSEFELRDKVFAAMIEKHKRVIDFNQKRLNRLRIRPPTQI